MTFRDHFATQAAAYREHRPGYPPELYVFLAGLVSRRALAWDCGTGSGQAAVALGAHFTRVIATDASAAQLAHAEPNARVEYRVAPAEGSGLPGASVDLVTVAQALHWFDVGAFFAEARRVLHPDGALAVWTYDDPMLDDPTLDAVVRRYSYETVGPYWPAERELVRGGYRAIPFPFAEVAVPPFTIERRWTLAELAGYLRTWSATTRYAADRGHDPVIAVEAELAAAWGAPDEHRRVCWPLSVRAGRPEG